MDVAIAVGTIGIDFTFRKLDVQFGQNLSEKSIHIQIVASSRNWLSKMIEIDSILNGFCRCYGICWN